MSGETWDTFMIKITEDCSQSGENDKALELLNSELADKTRKYGEDDRPTHQAEDRHRVAPTWEVR